MQWVRDTILLLPPTFWMIMRARPSYLLAISRFSFLRVSYACSVSSRRSRPLRRLTVAANGRAASAAGSARLSSLSVMEMRLPRRVVEATFASPPTRGSSWSSNACRGSVSCKGRTSFLCPGTRRCPSSRCNKSLYNTPPSRAERRIYRRKTKITQFAKGRSAAQSRSVFFSSWVTPRELCTGNDPMISGYSVVFRGRLILPRCAHSTPGGCA